MVVLIIAYVCGRESLYAEVFCNIPKPCYGRAEKPIVCKHDKHRLLDERKNKKWVEMPLKSVVIYYTERLLDQTWARKERSIGFLHLLLFCLPLSGSAVFRHLC